MASQNISQLGDFFYCPSCVLFNKKYRNVGQLEDVFTGLYWHKVTNNKLETSDHAGWLAVILSVVGRREAGALRTSLYFTLTSHQPYSINICIAGFQQGTDTTDGR